MGRRPKRAKLLSPFTNVFKCVDTSSVTGRTRVGVGVGHPRSGARTRTGCHSCRQRKIKCDENRPYCNRCSTAKLHCSYALRLQWHRTTNPPQTAHDRILQDVPDRKAHNVHRERGKQRDQPDDCTKDLFVGFTTGDLHLLCQSPSESDKQPMLVDDNDRSALHEPQLCNIYAQSTLSAPIPTEDDLQNDSYLRSILDKVLCPLASFIDDSDHNPMRTAIMPAISSSQLVRCAVQLCVIHYLGRHKHDRIYELHLQQKLLGLLREALSNANCFKDETLLAVVMLCSHSISTSAGPEWLAHLSYYWYLIDLRAQKRGTPEDETSAFRLFVGYFSSHLVLANTLFHIKSSRSLNISTSEKDAFEESSSKAQTDDGCTNLHHYLTSFTESIRTLRPSEDHDSIDIWNGYSSKLMTLISDITGLRDNARAFLHLPKPQHSAEMSIIGQKIKHFKLSLDHMRQRMPTALTSPKLSQKQTGVKLMQTRAETYRLATVILLHESSKPSFYGKSSQCSLPESMPLLSGRSIGHHTSAIFESVSLILQNPSLPFTWGLWPLFIAACYVCDEDEKVRVLHLFENARCKAPFENIYRAQKVVELFWLWRDITSNSIPPQTVGQYRWEILLSLLRWKPSFA